MPVISITRAERAAQAVLFIRRRIARAELPGTLAECFGALYGHAQTAGLAVAAFPLARYVSTGPGLWTVEPAIPLLTPAPSEGEMQAGFRPGGPVALGPGACRQRHGEGHAVGGAPGVRGGQAAPDGAGAREGCRRGHG